MFLKIDGEMWFVVVCKKDIGFWLVINLNFYDIVYNVFSVLIDI